MIRQWIKETKPLAPWVYILVKGDRQQNKPKPIQLWPVPWSEMKQEEKLGGMSCYEEGLLLCKVVKIGEMMTFG